MLRWGGLLAAALVVGAGAGRAQERLAPVPQGHVVMSSEVHMTATAGPGAPCCAGTRVCCAGASVCQKTHRLWDWLTYRPLSRPGLCGCCHPPAPCCTPPLYTFFPCACNATPLPPHEMPCAANGCAGGCGRCKRCGRASCNGCCRKQPCVDCEGPIIRKHHCQSGCCGQD